MSPRQHISNHLERLAGVLLPGGYWHLDRLMSRFFVEVCPAGLFAKQAIPHSKECPAMRNRVVITDARKA